MKNNVIRKFITIATLTFACGMVSGCGNAISEFTDKLAESKADEQAPKEDESDEGNENNTTETMQTKAEETESTEDSGTDTEESAPTENSDTEETTTAKSDSELSGDITDLTFSLDGKSYQLPLAFSELEAEGWTISPDESEFTNGYEVEANTKLIGAIDLVNPKYDEEVSFEVQFINHTDNALDYTKCDIWSVSMDVRYCDSPDAYPNMIVGNGVTFGCSTSEVESMVGPCDDIYESENHKQYTYSKDSRDVYFIIYPDEGVVEMELSGAEY